MRRATLELCIDFLKNTNVQQLGEHRDQVLAVYDAIDDLERALEALPADAE